MNELLPVFISTVKIIQPNYSETLYPLLDGSCGTNREVEKACQIQANHDYEAIQCWLAEYKHKDTTYRSYQKETERLLLWCILQRKKSLSSLNRDDFEAYFNFLSDPQPRQRWCAPKGGRHKRRGESSWRPFTGPLRGSAKNSAITIINSLMNYLVDARYLAFNPLLLIKKKNRHNIVEEHNVRIFERILEVDEWDAILVSIEEMPVTTSDELDEKERSRFLIVILFLLGLRADELEQHRWNAFRKIGEDWWFFLIGKGDKPGMIPVNDELINYVIRYRTYLQKMPLPHPEDDSPIIPSFRSKNALTARQMNNLIKQIVTQAAQKFPEHPEKAKKLQKVSVHWLRHLSATMQDYAGIDEKYIQENLRHANMATTRKYIHSRHKERHHEMQKLRLRSPISY